MSLLLTNTTIFFRLFQFFQVLIKVQFFGVFDKEVEDLQRKLRHAHRTSKKLSKSLESSSVSSTTNSSKVSLKYEKNNELTREAKQFYMHITLFCKEAWKLISFFSFQPLNSMINAERKHTRAQNGLDCCLMRLLWSSFLVLDFSFNFNALTVTTSLSQRLSSSSQLWSL